MNLKNWIFEENFKKFLMSLTSLVNYSFEMNELENLCLGLRGTETEKDIWLIHSFAGDETLLIEMGFDEPGSGIIMVTIEAPLKIIPEISAIFDSCQYDV